MLNLWPQIFVAIITLLSFCTWVSALVAQPLEKDLVVYSRDDDEEWTKVEYSSEACANGKTATGSQSLSCTKTIVETVQCFDFSVDAGLASCTLSYASECSNVLKSVTVKGGGSMFGVKVGGSASYRSVSCDKKGGNSSSIAEPKVKRLIEG